jgi:hypothetical protein
MDGLGASLARVAGGGALRVLVFLGRIYEIAFRIAMMMTDPGHGEGKCRRQADLFRVFESVSSAHLGVLRSEFFSGGGFVVFYWGFWQKRVAERGVFVVNLW